MDAVSEKYAQEIDQCDWLWLRSVEVTNGWGLRVVVEQLVSRIGPENLDRDFAPNLAERIRVSLPSTVRQALVFEAIFHECIGYTVWNETYSRMPEVPEMFTGRLFRRFSKSYMLDLAEKTTYARQDHPGPGPLAHYELVCQDDIVDVIACVEPTVRLVKVAEEAPTVAGA